jgi:hypothetical protein
VGARSFLRGRSRLEHFGLTTTLEQ